MSIAKKRLHPSGAAFFVYLEILLCYKEHTISDGLGGDVACFEGDIQSLAHIVLVVYHADMVKTLLQRHLAACNLINRVSLAVIHNQLAVDVELRTIVAGETEDVNISLGDIYQRLEIVGKVVFGRVADKEVRLHALLNLLASVGEVGDMFICTLCTSDILAQFL